MCFAAGLRKVQRMRCCRDSLTPEKSGLYRQANPAEHELGRGLSDSDRLVEPVGGHPFLVVGHHPNARKPLVQPDGRVFEEGARLGRKLLSAGFAFPDVPGGNIAMLFVRKATRALNTIGPAHCREGHYRRVWICIIPEGFRRCPGNFKGVGSSGRLRCVN